MYGALRWQEVAVLSVQRRDDEKDFELLTIHDEPGRLEARRNNDSIDLTCTLGHFGDSQRERKVLDRVTRRLRELAGVGARPLSW